MRLLLTGNTDYGCQIAPEKSLINFHLVLDGQIVNRVQPKEGT